MGESRWRGSKIVKGRCFFLCIPPSRVKPSSAFHAKPLFSIARIIKGGSKQGPPLSADTLKAAARLRAARRRNDRGTPPALMNLRVVSPGSSNARLSTGQLCARCGSACATRVLTFGNMLARTASALCFRRVYAVTSSRS